MTESAAAGGAERLISNHLRSLLGRPVDPRRGTVHKPLFQRWAMAAGDRNPLYFDPASARAHGHPDVVMPPAYIVNVCYPVVPMGELRPDGIVSDGEYGHDRTLPLCSRILGAGVDYAFHAPCYDGDEIRSTLTFSGAEPKHGRQFGDFVLLSRTWHYRRGDELVAQVTRHVIARP